MEKARAAELLALDHTLRSCSVDTLTVLLGSFDHGAKPAPEVRALVEQVLKEKRRAQSPREWEA